MNSPVTWKAILFIFGGTASVGLLGYGILSMLAGNMSDNPSEGVYSELLGMIMIVTGALGVFGLIMVSVLL